MYLNDIGTGARTVQQGGRFAVITDENIAALYLERVKASLEEAGFSVSCHVIPAGEEQKNGAVYLRLLSELAAVPLTRTDGVVALGGGVIGDLAGFTAATYMRGIKVIQVPTTLLAQVDSSIGGKTAIDLPEGKNLAGAFHMPALVWRDPAVLGTLPEALFRDGMAEVIKYALIDGDGFPDLSDPAAVRRAPEAVIERSAAIKEQIVLEDAKDLGIRQILNLGHTIGHAVEKLSAYRLSHGQAVAKGLARIAEIALDQGWCGEEVPARTKALLTAYGFDLEIPYGAEEIFGAITRDKKRKNDSIDIIVPEAFGRCVIRRLSLQELRAIL